MYNSTAVGLRDASKHAYTGPASGAPETRERHYRCKARPAPSTACDYQRPGATAEPANMLAKLTHDVLPFPFIDGSNKLGACWLHPLLGGGAVRKTSSAEIACVFVGVLCATISSATT